MSLFDEGFACRDRMASPRNEDIHITYEVSCNEPVHPDLEIAARFREIAIGDCEFGCKIYADPQSRVRVLAHNSAYGCRK